MEHTRRFFTTIGVVGILAAWAVVHLEFWLWLLPREYFWAWVGGSMTAGILPGLGLCLYLDLATGEQ